MDALVRVDAHRSRIGEPKRAARQQPIVKQAEPQPLAKLEFQVLDKLPLRDIENEDESRDKEEDAELVEKVPQVAPRQGIEERLIPAVEANLSVGGGCDDQNHGGQQKYEHLARRRAEDRARDESNLPRKAQMGGLALWRVAGDFCGAFHYRAGHFATL